MRVLNVQEIAMLAKEVVREVGPEYFDAHDDKAYVYIDGQNCLVGAVLKQAGVNLRELALNHENNVGSSSLVPPKEEMPLCELDLKIRVEDEAAGYFLAQLQEGNDNEEKWEDALNFAIESVESLFHIKLNLQEYCEVADEVEQLIQDELIIQLDQELVAV